MAATDKIHQPVKSALIRDGWTITNDPFTLDIGTDTLYADLKAEREVAGNAKQVIVVEVKSFSEKSLIHALQQALGQYQIYRNILEDYFPDFALYLAVSMDAYKELQLRTSFQILMRRKQLALIVVDIGNEEIVAWID
jgi:hypothetical protein